jgi:hypothetical protein
LEKHIVDIRENYRKLEREIVTQLNYEVGIHQLTTGTNREYIWEDFFRRIIPKKFNIERSVFIIDSNNNCSNEVDIAIYDEQYTPYIFNYGVIKFIPIEAVAAVVQCKSRNLDKGVLTKWVKSIKRLKTSNDSVARLTNFIHVGAEDDKSKLTQTATTPIQILCYISDEKSNDAKNDLKGVFDIVIEAYQKYTDDKGNKEDKNNKEDNKENTNNTDDKNNGLNIAFNKDSTFNKNPNLYEVLCRYNRVGETTESNDSRFTDNKSKDTKSTKEKLEEIKVEDFKVKDKKGECTLLSFIFQFNQFLMLINNPIFFPHRAYVKMFNIKNIVVIAIDKIQKYIFKRIDETKTDNKTLSDIMGASNTVAKDILNKIKTKFNVKLKEENGVGDDILWISGKVVFRTELEEVEIRERLKELFKEVYKDYAGNIFLRYEVFAKNLEDEMSILKQVNELLKSPKNKSQVIQDNKDILFNFQELNSKSSEDKNKNLKDKNPEDNYDYKGVFLNDMDDLVNLDDKHDSDSTNGKIAIVKADINNLGKIMPSIDDYNDFLDISNLLKEKISIKSFGEYIKEHSKDNKVSLIKKILPFFIEGDDIFYAVRVDGVLDSIKLLHKIIMDINNKITDIDSSINIKLKLAIGVVFVNNHQPIRYYNQMVEDELGKAKKKMKDEKEFNSVVGIRMSDNSFHIYSDSLGYGESDGFFRFCNEVEALKEMMKKGVFTNTSLHNLLINLEIEKDEEKQLYYVLYFLRPNLQRGEKVNDDVYFKYYWLSQLVEDKRGDRKERGFDSSKINDVLIPKLKLVLFFLRDRYSSNIDVNENKNSINSNKDETEDERIHSVMFHKPLNYFLNNKANNNNNKANNNKDKIISLFIKKDYSNKKVLYKSANFSTSIFYRAKNLIESGKCEQVITLFENYIASISNKSEEKDSQDTNQTQSIHRIEFKLDEFKKLFNELSSKDTTWLDKLILCYKYNEQRIILKTSKKLENEKNNGKNNNSKKNNSKKN